MLILKITEEREQRIKNKGRFRKKVVYENYDQINRYTINVSGKNVVVLELSEKNLENEDVATILRVYNNRVLVEEKYKRNKILVNYLFNPKAYYQRAVLSSLTNQIKTLNKDWQNICVKLKFFLPFNEFFSLVKISKNVTVITDESNLTDMFLNRCFCEYGAVVKLKNECATTDFDVFLDLDAIDNKGKVMIEVKGKTFLLYPDNTYFSNDAEYEKLQCFNLEHNEMCAAFSDMDWRVF